MRAKSVVALIGAAALAVPGSAVATAPEGKAPSKAPATSPKAKKSPKVAYNVKGTIKSVDAAANTVTITVGSSKGSTNKAARAWRGKDVVFSAAKAKLAVTDVNADGKRDLADIAAGNSVSVLALLPKRLEGTTEPYAAKRVKVKAAQQKKS